MNGETKIVESERKTGGHADKIPCNSCKELIALGAAVCHHCGRNQKRLIRWLGPTVQLLGILVSITLVALSYAQHTEAKHQRQSADAAFNRAAAAEAGVIKVAKTATSVFESIMERIGRWDSSYTPEEIEEVIRPLKEAIAESKYNNEANP